MLPHQQNHHRECTYGWDLVSLPTRTPSDVSHGRERPMLGSISSNHSLMGLEPGHASSSDLVIEGGHRRGVQNTDRKMNKQKYKGVFRIGKKFKAQVQSRGVQFYLGTYDTAEEAAKAYDAHAIAVLGAKAKTNFKPAYIGNTKHVSTSASILAPLNAAYQPSTQPEIFHSESGMKRIKKRAYEGIKFQKKRIVNSGDAIAVRESLAPASIDQVEEGRNIIEAAIKKLTSHQGQQREPLIFSMPSHMESIFAPLENFDVE